MDIIIKKTYFRLLVMAWIICIATSANAQGPGNSIIVNLAMLDGIEINSDNVFNYQIINNSNAIREALIKGTLRYKNSPLQFSYSYKSNLQPGSNQFNRNMVISPTWSFSNSALRELFLNYNKLPQGTYEYCVTVTLKEINPENFVDAPVDGCIYQTVNDIFLINLVDPESDAKIREFYPMLSWIVNYPFASELTYRIRVAALNKGQNNENAITRNNPVYQDNSITSTNVLYPATAKPLVKFQPYVWAVDAFYRGILLGGSEAWRFTIVDDSLLSVPPSVQSYYDFQNHKGETSIEAVGTLKLRYVSDRPNDTLYVSLFDKKGKHIELEQKYFPMANGDNRIDIEFFEKVSLVHNRLYELRATNKEGKEFKIPFTYTNPLFLK